MSNQTEGPNVKLLTVKIPWELYYQLKRDAQAHQECIGERARHILGDALMDVPLTKEDYDEIEQAIAAAITRIRAKVSKKRG